MIEFRTLREIERAARSKIDDHAWDWLECGTENELTLQRNRQAFERVALRPRIFRDVSHVDLTTQVAGLNLPVPVIVCPLGGLTIYDDGGEEAIAQGITGIGSILCVSAMARLKLSEIRAAAPRARLMYLVFFMGPRNWIEEQVREAEALGVEGICVGADAPTRGIRYRDRENRYNARKFGRTTNPPPPDHGTNAKTTWKDIKWLRSITKVPLIIKGVMTGEDGRLSREHGADAVWVSNHGGRQVDSGLAPLEALEEVREAVSGTDIIVDGGVRGGGDVVRALAMGAKAVGLGRSIVYGLAVGGADGVRLTMELFREEMLSIMANIGCPSIADLNRDMIRIRPC
ncbi:MAG: alpha-hydroxy-acid oxidizing protein [Deltaproteobacteria bacterium]|nr:alpha-hydroxy-acid oxidizing protein [Deltaproteobacteria bacterium]